LTKYGFKDKYIKRRHICQFVVITKIAVTGDIRQLQRLVSRFRVQGDIIGFDGKNIGDGEVRVVIDCMECTLFTLWESPKEWICNVSGNYPSLTFEIDYLVIQRAISGKTVIKNKEILKDDETEFGSVEELITYVNSRIMKTCRSNFTRRLIVHIQRLLIDYGLFRTEQNVRTGSDARPVFHSPQNLNVQFGSIGV